MNTYYIILGIVVLLVLYFILLFNGLVRRKNQVEEAWSDIEVQLKRRYDLIPNVVEAVKGYAAHERGIFENVTRARSEAMGAKTLNEHAQAENTLSGTLKTLFAVAENYPQLRANENFLDLQRELTDTEDKIQSARRFYNSMVRDYNIALQTFPANTVAASLGFAKKDFFGLENESESKPVQVGF